jgi:SAM-dependent methyltransferase
MSRRSVADPVRRLAVCPACRGDLAWGDVLGCSRCGRTYALHEGIPVLVHDLSEKQVEQVEFFDAEDDAEYETTRPVGLPRFHAWLLRQKFALGTDGLREEIAGHEVLVVCGGSGMDAQFIAELGGVPVSSDISLHAVLRARERGRRFGFPLHPLVASAEKLPFADRSVDVVFVHDGLHHLEDPLPAVREMARVARRAVSVNEPARALVTRAAVRAGVAEEVEEAGNRVARLSTAEVSRTLEEEGFVVRRARRYGMFYRHRPGLTSRVLSAPVIFGTATTIFRGVNGIIGSGGNKLSVQAVRSA